jgi:hypothetical protein
MLPTAKDETYPRWVLIALVAAVVAGIVALLRGGSLEDLAATKFRWIVFLLTGLALQLVFEVFFDDRLTGEQALTIVLMSYLMIVTFLLVNRHLPGLTLAAVGLALNVVVIAANGAMPVGERAIELIGVEDVRDFGVKHEPLTDDTLLPWIADVIPVPGIGTVISAGDLVLAAGIAYLVYARALAGRREVATPASG